MSTVYAQRSSAVRAAKKACGLDQEWVIQPMGDGFTFTVLDIEEKQPALVTTAEKVEAGVIKVNIAKARKEAAILAETGATEAEHATHRAEPPKSTIEKPFQMAKRIVAEMVAAGKGTRKEVMAAGLAAGIKYNTIDGAYFEMCVRKS